MAREIDRRDFIKELDFEDGVPTCPCFRCSGDGTIAEDVECPKCDGEGELER